MAAHALEDHLVDQGFPSGFDAVVVSGDLSWTNKTEEFLAAKFFLEELSTTLSIPLDRIVVIPGNHDISWSEADPGSTSKFRYLIREQAERGYQEFYVTLLGRPASGYLTDVRIFHAQKVVIAGLNSCQLNSKRDAGLGYVGRAQIEQVLRELSNDPAYARARDQFFKIAVVHHHLLPMSDIDFAELDKPPGDRKFTLTVDAKAVVDLLLADNFAIVLHGHQHSPFCAVERRLQITNADPIVPADCQIMVSAAGSLFVRPPDATHNQFQVIDLDEKAVTISGVELHRDPHDNLAYKQFAIAINRALLTRPPSILVLRDEDAKLLEDHLKTLEESLILAENVAKGDPPSHLFLMQTVRDLALRLTKFNSLDPVELEVLYGEALELWLRDPFPLKRYEDDGKKALLSFPDFILRLMLAIHEDRGNDETE
jgi:hypothetical protein